MLLPKQNSRVGNTLPELMISVLILGVFFASIFEMSGICLRYISSSKENISAIECVQDRIEQLRNADFADLKNPTFLTVVPAVPNASPSPSPPQRRNLTVPSNASELATQATEEVTISTYANGGPTTPSVKYVRPSGARVNTAANFSDTNITPTVSWTGGSSFPATTTAVQVDVKYTWKATFGNRSRSESSSTIIAAGTKK